MWIDKRAEFSASSALTAGTAVVGDYYNFGGDFDQGPGVPLYLNVVVLSAPAHLASETYTFNLLTDDNSGFASATTILTFTIDKNAPVGSKYSFALPMQNEQYMELQAVLADGGGTAAITVEAWIGATPTSQQRAYPDAI